MNLYNVYRVADGALLADSVDAQYVSGMTGIPPKSIIFMARRDETTDGMRISLAETEVQTQNVPVGILKEWDATRHLFSKVRWVKTPDPGVRRLKLRK